MSHHVYYLPIHWIYSGFLSHCSPSPCLLHSPVVSPPCCILTVRLLSKKSLKCSCWCLSAGEEQGRLKFVQEKLGKSEWRALRSRVRVCAMRCCRAPGLISRKLYLLFGSSVACRWPETLNKQGAFDTLPVPFHPNHPWQLQTGVTEIAKAEKFRVSPSYQVNRHPRVAGHNHQPRIYFCNVTICPPPVVLTSCISEAKSINEMVMAEASIASFLLPTVHLGGIGCCFFSTYWCSLNFT